MTDASYAEGDPRPLAIRAQDGDDLRILSALVQDAILSVADLSFDRRGRHVALLLNRFRWEDAEAAEREGRPYERVRSLLVIRDVLRMLSDGIPRDPDTVLELLALQWQPGEDGTGRLLLECAGDGTFALEVEALDVDLRDVTRPHVAVSGQKPRHPA